MKRRNDLEKFCIKIRIETLKQIGNLGFGHVGGCMSIAETLAVLYGGVMKTDSANPKWEQRDWLVISKGHAGPAIYSTLALRGFFDMSLLKTLNRGGTSLPSHCDKNKTIGIDVTTGSLGQGISQAIGIALGHKLKKMDNWVYLILGDGELQEGQVWEGAMFAPHHNLDNLIAFVDNNKQQLDGFTQDILNVESIHKKFEAFNWHVQSIDGHDVIAIEEAVECAKKAAGKPSVIILETQKGKCCTYTEGVLDNHHISVCEQDTKRAVAKLEAQLAKYE
ncbi:MAG: transketolase [Clostridia bacterium]|nr:transketolase [Clostridia bacterium]